MCNGDLRHGLAREKKKAEEEAKKRAEEEQRRHEAVEKRRKIAAAAAARNCRGPSPGEASTSARRVEVSKGKAPQKADASGGDPDDGDEDEEEKEPCERCKAKKIPCLQQAGKQSSIICKPCHDAKVRCSYLTRPPTAKKEVVSNPTGKRLAVLESQMAQMLADNRVLREGQVRANTNDCHILKKLDWLMRDAARRREESPEEPIAGPSVLPKKRRRVVDSEEEREEEREQEGVEEEEEEDKPAPKKARSEKGKEREE
ncbi:hypothetical protein EV359DRAFT_86192 [Lentinula novae-zelandiae]|nr:hypothetical protein EV359DRAFT_86192 [Lentinula novae-zelandiae]